MTLVFNFCLSELLPESYECSALDNPKASMGNNFFTSDKCERVDPAKRQMLQEKVDAAASFLSKVIANILKYFTNKKKVQMVRLDPRLPNVFIVDRMELFCYALHHM